MTIRVDAAAIILTVWTWGFVAATWGLGIIRAGHIRTSMRALYAITLVGLGALAVLVAVSMFVFTGRPV